MADETIEAAVGLVNDFNNGEMKEVEVNGVKVLLLKEGGVFYATGAKCSHYGAPLVNGVFCDGRVRCPWHGACFNIRNGDIEDFPGLDSIPTFDVEVKNNKVFIKAKKSLLENAKRVKSALTSKPTAGKTALIIGGGPAATVCAETLRQEGFTGPITIATKENHLPYDRPKLSKVLNVTAEQIALRDRKFFEQYNIDVALNKEATSVQPDKKKVTFRDGDTRTYDVLILATGTYARKLSMVPGYDLKNITTLRTVDDAQFIGAQANGKDVVIIGTSFIGVEVAAALVGKAKSVTVVDRANTPFQLALGQQVGTVVKKLMEEKGIKFQFNTTAKEFVGNNGTVTQVILTDGTVLPADLCVCGVGVGPATDFLKGSGVKISERGFVVVNKHMETNQKDVFAIGDIAEFPLFLANDSSVNIQHWQMAHQQGCVCALNITGKKVEINSIPFFWTALLGKSIRYTGYGVGYDDIVIHGNLDEPKFVAFYTKGDSVIAVASMNFDPVVAQAADMMLQRQTITKTEVLKEPLDWAKRLKSSQCTHF